MNRSDTLTKIAPALVKALAKIDGVAKTQANPGFKGSKYATLEAVIDASKDSLTEHGLTVLQLAGPLVGGVLTMETMILHESGEYISGEFGIALAKQDPQGVGSAVTYARRYALMAALNMPAVDDDGETAMGRGPGHSYRPSGPAQNLSVAPMGPDFWGCASAGPGPTAHAFKKAGGDTRHDEMRQEITRLTTADEWRRWCSDNKAEIASMPTSYRILLRQDAEEQARELGVDLNQRSAA